jgi:hypothetical protein
MARRALRSPVFKASRKPVVIAIARKAFPFMPYPRYVRKCAPKRAWREQALSDLASPGNRLGAVSAMLKGVPVTLRRPRRSSAVHPAPTVRHCGLLARLPGRPAVGTSSRAELHRQFALHGVDPRLWHDPRPPTSRPCPPLPDRQPLDRFRDLREWGPGLESGKSSARVLFNQSCASTQGKSSWRRSSRTEQ